jgi:hypothetical protein
MALTRRTLLQRASLGALALALGEMPKPAPAEAARLLPLDAVPALHASRTLPVGWLPLDGRTITRSEYPELHTALRGIYAPNGPLAGEAVVEQDGEHDIEFAVPDMRGSALGMFMQDELASPHMATMGPFVGEIHWKIRTDEETA